MKLFSNKYLTFDILIVVVVICLFFLYLWSFTSINGGNRISGGESFGYEMTGKKYDFELIQDSIYKLENEINKLKHVQDEKQGSPIGSTGQGSKDFGVYKYSDSFYFGKDNNKVIYLTTGNWDLNSDNDPISARSYYHRNGKSFIRIPVLTKISKGNFKHHYEDKEVRFRYDQREKRILFPLKKNYQIIIGKICIWVEMSLSIFLMLLGVVLFIRFLVSVSRNKIFESYNIRRLSLISLICFFTVLFPYVITLIVYMIYSKELSELVFVKKFTGTDFNMIVAGVFFAVLYRAFKKGQALKEENELTV